MIRWTALTLLVICIHATAATHGWKLKHEYLFSIEGQSMAGITSINDTMTGIHHKGILRVQMYKQNLYIMKLENMTYARLHKRMPDGWWSNTSLPEGSYQPLPITDSSFSVTMKNGLVVSIVIPLSVKPWESNYISGVVSELQYDLLGHNAVNHKVSNSLPGLGDYKTASLLTINEESVAGCCEVQYEVTSIPNPMIWVNPDWAPRIDVCDNKKYLQVLKTRNFDKCRNLSEYHFGLPASLSCHPGGNTCGEFWKRSSVTRIIGCGDRRDFLMLSSVNSHRAFVNLHLHRGTEASVNSNLKINLLSEAPTRKSLSLPTQPTQSKRTLVYQYTPPDFEPRQGEGSNADTANAEYDGKSVTHDKGNRSNGRTRTTTEATSQSIEVVAKHPKGGKVKPSRRNYKEQQAKDTPKKPGSQHSGTHMKHAPNRPFSAFALAHREGDAHSCMVQQLKELVTDISKDLQEPKVIPERKTLEKADHAIEVCRSMMLADLETAVSGVMNIPPNSSSSLRQTERKVFRDLYVMCGTGPSFTIVKSWITQGMIQGEEGADILATIPTYLQVSDKNIIKEFYDLIQSPAVKRHKQMTITGLLSFSTLLRVACVDEKTRSKRYSDTDPESLCTPEVAAPYVLQLEGEMSSNPELKRVLLAALGNTGDSHVLTLIKDVVEDRHSTVYLRTAAVLAMREFVLRDKDKMIPLLLDIYRKYDNPLTLRITALSLLLYGRPTITVWHSIAISTWFEPNPAMVSFVWTTLSTMAKSSDLTYGDMFDSAKAVLPLAKPITQSTHQPFNIMRSTVSNDVSYFILEQLSLMISVEGSNLYYRITRRLGALSRIIAQVDFWIANPQRLCKLMCHFIKGVTDNVLPRRVIGQPIITTSFLHEFLKIAQRTAPEMKGELRFIHNKLHERLFPIDEKIVNKTFEAIRSEIDEWNSGKDFHCQKINQEAMEMETTDNMGFPISFSLKTMWVTRATGRVQKDSQELNLDIGMMYASQVMSSVSIYPPWDTIKHMAASHAVTMSQLPSMRINVGMRKQGRTEGYVNIQLLTADNLVPLIAHSSYGFTAQREILFLTPASESKSVSYIPLKNEREMITFTYVDITYASESKPKKMVDWLKEAIVVYGFPMMWHDVKPAYFLLELNDLRLIKMNFSVGNASVNHGGTTYGVTFDSILKSGVVIKSETQSIIAKSLPQIPNDTENSNFPIIPRTERMANTSTNGENNDGNSTSDSDIDVEPSGHDIEDTTISTNEKPEIRSFNATDIYPFTGQLNGSNINYLLRHMLTGFESGQAMVIAVNATVGETNTAYYGAFFGYAHTLQSIAKRFAFFFKKKNINWQMGLTTSLYNCPRPLLDERKALESEKIAEIMTDLVAYGNNEGSKQNFDTFTYRSKEHTRNIERTIEGGKCLRDISKSGDAAFVTPACRSVMYQTGIPDRIDMRVTTNTKDSNISDTFEAAAALSTIAVSGSTDIFRLWVQSRHEQFNNTFLPLLPDLKFPVVPLKKGLQSESSCGIKYHHISTYDGVHYNYSMSNCWHILTKDCSGRNRVYVMGRKLDKYTELMLNVENYKIVNLIEKHVYVNNVSIPLEPDTVVSIVDRVGTVILEITASPDRVVKVNMPEHDMHVLYSFTGTDILISTGVSNNARLCGLCGDSNGQIQDDFRDAKGEIQPTVEKFASSYELNVETCNPTGKL